MLTTASVQAFTLNENALREWFLPPIALIGRNTDFPNVLGLIPVNSGLSVALQ